MTSDEGLLLAIDALEALGVEYMVVGSFSSNFYGIPRSTKDADLVVQLGSASITAISKRVAPTLVLDAQSSFESVTGTTCYVFRHAESTFYVELFLLSADPHDQARFGRRQLQPLSGRTVFLASPEDVVVTKLRWYAGLRRSRDREDIRSVLGVRQAALDWPYVHGWCEQHGTRQLLDEIRATVPEV